jgi:hypothetical protein
MDLTLTHTAGEGTILEGTSRGDTAGRILRGRGWRFSRAITAWYIPYSRDREPKQHLIDTTVQALRDAGFSVDVSIDTTHRAMTDIEADRITRERARAEHLAHRAEHALQVADEQEAQALSALRRVPPMGEPIKVGHHSEPRHRASIRRADAAMRRSAEADHAASRAQARADLAAGSTDRRYEPIAVANRIARLQTEITACTRKLDGYSHTFAGGFVETYPPAQGPYAQRLTRTRDAAVDELDYWQAVRDEQVAIGLVAEFTRENVHRDDQVLYSGTWCLVTRINPKSVSVCTPHGTTGTVPYTHIRQHRPATNGASS